MPIFRTASFFALGSVLTFPLAAETRRLPVTRDVWISAFPSEQSGNNGAAPRIKAKGIQEFFLVDAGFDSLRGLSIRSAVLHLFCETPDTPLRRTTFSTVAVPWGEGDGTSYTKNTGGASFLSSGTGPWAGPKGNITDVTLGQAGTFWSWCDPSPPDAGQWQTFAVDPALIQACAEGMSHGLLVLDDTGSEYTRDGDDFAYHLFPNRLFASRDSNRSKAPYFTLEVSDSSSSPVSRPPAASEAAPPPVLVLPEGSAPGEGTPPPAGFQLTSGPGIPLKVLSLAGAQKEILTLRAVTKNLPPSLSFPAPVEVSVARVLTVGSTGDPVRPAQPEDAGGDYLIEIYIPACAPGQRTGTLTLDGTAHPLQLQVWNFTLPDRLSFVPQMNAYGLPGHELEYYRLAQRHRTCLNVLRYSWTGNVNDGAAPGADWDWTAWDARFGPLLDGSAFAGLPRGPVPVEHFYLPLNEHWPADVHTHFRGGYWTDSAFDPGYWEKFEDAARRIATHVKEKGWRDPLLEFYLNNKVYFKAERHSWKACSAPWIFDEPVNTQDFAALRDYGLRFRQAAADLAPNCVFRVDISRPEWQRDLLDGISGVEVISGVLRDYQARTAARQREWGTLVTMYGQAAPPGDLLQPVAWSLEAWTLGAAGILPWQTIGNAASWEKPDPLAIFYPGPDGPLASLRLKSFTWAQQLIEYLTLYGQTAGVSRESLAAAVREALQLTPEFHKTSEADAGTSLYSAVTPEALENLRLALGQALDKAAPPPKSRLVNLHPPVPAPGRIPKLPAVLKTP